LKNSKNNFKPIFDIIRHAIKIKIKKALLLKMDNKIFVNIVKDNIVISDFLHATIGYSAIIKERRLIKVFQMIQKRSLLKINRRSSIEDINGRTPSKNM
jgi:hypothetical protein